MRCCEQGSEKRMLRLPNKDAVPVSLFRFLNAVSGAYKEAPIPRAYSSLLIATELKETVGE